MQAEQLKERCRLCWRLLLARWRLWVSVLRIWRSELWVRVALARYALAIYRRELLHHKYEAARMEADDWGDYSEDFGSGWEDSEELDSGAPAETCATDVVLEMHWRTWGRLSVVGWLLLIPASWASVFFLRGGMEFLSFWSFGTWVGLAAVWNGLPGAAALLNPQVRERLRSMPEAAALSSLTLAAVVGLCGGFMATCFHLEMPVHIALSGIAFGIMFFPLTFGLVFPLAVPLVCCFAVWTLTKRYGRIPRMGYALLTGVSAAGWVGVSVIGPVMGLGG